MEESTRIRSEKTKPPASLKSSCKNCYSKKIRCDRKFPCGQCTRSSVHCGSRRRKPRTIDHNEPGFWSRLAHLENIVDNLGGEIESRDSISNDNAPTNIDASHVSTKESDNAMRRTNLPAVTTDGFIGHALWSSLATEVHALREALQDEYETSEDECIKSTPVSMASYCGSATDHFMFSPLISAILTPENLLEPEWQIQKVLFDVYCENVDRSFKILHIPTLRRFVDQGVNYLGTDRSAPCHAALKATIWFAAVNSLSETQCWSLFGNSKADQTEFFRRRAEIAFTEANLLATKDLITLQALAVYIAALRSIDKSRRCWTLLAVAIRIARGMSLHRELPSRSAFENELRRRLWHHLRLLDVFCVFDRSSEPLISLSSYTTPVPHNTNDSEFDEGSDTICEPHQPCLTEMSFGLLHFEAVDLWHQLAAMSQSPSDGDIWQHRMKLVQDYAEHARVTCLRLCDLSDPFHRFMQNVSRFTVSSMMLQAVRPEQENMSTSPPRADNPHVLRIAINCLKVGEEMQTDLQTQKWVWMAWLQWRALVVALAGLCTIRDIPLATEAWIWVEAAYSRYPGLIADTSSGMLWRPMVRLYQKAKMFKDYGSSSGRLVGTAPDHQNSIQLHSSNEIDMDVWEANALNAIEAMPQIDFADLGLDDPAFHMGAIRMDHNGLTNDMSLFIQSYDWNWLNAGLN